MNSLTIAEGLTIYLFLLATIVAVICKSILPQKEVVKKEPAFMDLQNDPYENEYMQISELIPLVHTHSSVNMVLTKITAFDNKYRNTGNRSWFVLQSDISRLLSAIEEQQEKLKQENVHLQLHF